jgi:hypothetical protein
VDTSKIKRKVLQYNDRLDDYDLLNWVVDCQKSFKQFFCPTQLILTFHKVEYQSSDKLQTGLS